MFIKALLEALTFGALLLLPVLIYAAVRLGKGLAEDVTERRQQRGEAS